MARCLRAAGLAAALAGSLAGCVSAPPPPRQPATPPPAAIILPDAVRIRVGSDVHAVKLEDYVLGSVLAEIAPAVGDSATTTERVFEVQAILARTYALANLGRHGAEGFDLCDTTHCQVYDPARISTSRYAGAARAAVEATRGRVITFGGRLAQTLFHADCGGSLAAAESVWGGDPVAYLRGGIDQVPAGTHRQWRFEQTAPELLAALNADPRSAIGPYLADIRVTATDAGGRATTVDVVGEWSAALRGEQLRSILNSRFGPTAIRSTQFVVTRAGDAFTFSGAGYGHGVGLCQVGAIARARRGEPVGAILAAYYPGTRLTTGLQR
jgi:SpoIID/LytB domain protein